MAIYKCSLYLPTGATIVTDIDGEWRITPDFRLWELANKDAKESQLVNGIRFVLESDWSWLMVNMIQTTRDHFDSRLDVNSFYRTQAYNDSLPNATHDSQHCHGQAGDLVDYYNVGTDDDWVHWWEKLCARTHQIGAIGLYPDFRHLEIGSDRRYGATKFQVRDYR